LKLRQVDRIHPHDADRNEPLRELRQRVIPTGNLPVKRSARQSRNAPKDDEERFVLAFRAGDSGVEVVVNPVIADFGVFESVLKRLRNARSGKHTE
jgi:hypothetical protein